jgi:multiple sugar transport system substrate-binding protein
MAAIIMNRNPLAFHSTRVLRIITAGIVLVIAAGCGAPAPATAPTSAAPAPTGAPVPTAAPIPSTATQATAQATAQATIALQFAFPDDAASARAAEGLIQAYSEANSAITIAPLPLPAADYSKQLLARIAAGGPDLFVGADAQAPALIDQNAVLDLRALLADAPLAPGEFQPAALAPWQRGDALFGLPADVTPQVLFYNQDMFDAAGVAYPAIGWTWDDWLASAKKLTLSDGGKVSTYGTALTQWSAMVWGNGGELLTPDGKQTLLDQPAAAEGVQFAADMVNLHKVAPPPKDAGGPDPIKLFQEQGVAMMPGSSSLAATLRAANLPFKWAIAPLPAGKTPATPLSVSGLLISAQSQNQHAALGFAAWAVGPQGQAIRADLLPFAAPALRSAGARPAGLSGAETIVQALEHGRTLPQVAAWPDIKAIVDKSLVPVWQGQTTAQAAYRAAAPEINARLAAA